MIDEDECGVVGGMSDRINRITQRKPTPLLLCPPQVSHDLNWARTWAAAVGCGLLIATARFLHREYKHDLCGTGYVMLTF
jgi:hypothetical protein